MNFDIIQSDLQQRTNSVACVNFNHKLYLLELISRFKCRTIIGIMKFLSFVYFLIHSKIYKCQYRTINIHKSEMKSRRELPAIKKFHPNPFAF